jgi:hypothetical protein
MRQLVQRISLVGRVLIVATVVVAVAIVASQSVVSYVAAAPVCVCWIGVYSASDPMHRAARGDDPAQDAVNWRDREPE